MFIGPKLEAIRKAKKVSLTELAERSGVQLATLSRIEHKKMVGTLECHLSIAKALGIDVTDLYRDIDSPNSRIEYKDPQSKTDVFKHNDHASHEILTRNVLKKRMAPVLVRIESRGKTNLETLQPGTERFIYVLEGAVEAVIKEEKFTLNKNSSLYFDASLPHMFANIGKTPVKMLSISTPVSL